MVLEKRRIFNIILTEMKFEIFLGKIVKERFKNIKFVTKSICTKFFKKYF